jgi:hypothetical protein
MVYLLSLHLLNEKTSALFSAIIFSIHPLFSEAINYISARSTLLATLFYLMALYYFLKLRTSGTKNRSSKSLIFSLFTLSMVFAILSKEIAVTLPLMLLVYDWLFTRRSRSHQDFNRILPYIPITLMVLLLLYQIDFIHFLKSIYLTHDFHVSNLWAILAQIKGLALLFWLFFVPLGLSIDHGIPRPESIYEPGMIGALALLLTILGCAFFLIRSQKVVAFFLFWFAITAMPTTLVPLNIPFMEHRGYLPGVGLSMIMGWALGKLVYGQWLDWNKKGTVETNFGLPYCPCCFLYFISG